MPLSDAQVALVLRLLARGIGNAAIARAAATSQGTVASIRRELFDLRTCGQIYAAAAAARRQVRIRDVWPLPPLGFELEPEHAQRLEHVRRLRRSGRPITTDHRERSFSRGGSF
jgi:hypothetical protein